MSRTCRLIFFTFLLAYVLALGLLAIGTLGLFGSEADPLAGVFVVPLGLPWNLLLDGFPSSARPWLAAGAPLLNLFVIWLACRITGSAKR